jgi:hypothetical protein
MRKSLGLSIRTKVFYRPIEAAIRWSELVQFESRILDVLGNRKIPDPADFPRWPKLRLNIERIFDALANDDLPYGKQGITCEDRSVLDDPDLTIRHVDLKAWMLRCYPHQKPAFLFDTIERHFHPAVRIDVVQTLLADREALKVQLANRLKAWELLHTQFQALSTEHQAQLTEDKQAREPGPRSESTYLSIVGALLSLLLGKSPGGVPYSSFHTMESVISALIAHHTGRPGISERTLWAKFSAAKRHLSSTEP